MQLYTHLLHVDKFYIVKIDKLTFKFYIYLVSNFKINIIQENI